MEDSKPSDVVVNEEIITKNELEDLTLQCHYVYNNIKLYVDKNNRVKLFKDDVELTKGILDATEAYYYWDDLWVYRDEKGYVHLYKKDINITEGIHNARGVGIDRRTDKWYYVTDTCRNQFFIDIR